MRRLVLVLAMLLSVCSTLDAQVRLRGVGVPSIPGGGGSAPDTPSAPYPAVSATGVSLTHGLACVSANATSFAVYFGTNNPPTNLANGVSLGATCAYTPATMTVSTVYYWKICATNANGTTCNSPWSFTTTDGVLSFVSHPRLFLTTSKTTALLAKKKANHADYVAMKSIVDDNLFSLPWLAYAPVTLSASLTSSATSFSVTGDASIFATSSVYVRIDKELILCSTRTANLFTGCTRHVTWTWNTVTEAHASGAEVWYYATPSGQWLAAANATALLAVLGDTTYNIPARSLLNLALLLSAQVFDGGVPIYCNQDYFRWYSPVVSVGYDWLNLSVLTTNEKTVMAEWLRQAVRDQQASDDPAAGGLVCRDAPKEWFAVKFIGTPSMIESVLVSNAASGQVYATTVAAAATYGENADAGTQWTEALRKIDTYIIPAITTGSASGGMVPEGTQYQGETIDFVSGAITAIDTATGDTSRNSALNTWLTTTAKGLFYQTLPGAQNSATTTTGAMTSGSPTLVVADATSFEVGHLLRVVTGVGVLESRIMAKVGTTLTLRDASTATFSGQAVLHAHSTVFSRGDTAEHQEDAYNEGWFGDEVFKTAFRMIDHLKGSNPTVAGYLRWWYDNEIRATQNFVAVWKFIDDDTTVTPVDYHAGSLPLLWANTTNAAGNGILIGRSDWTTSATVVMFQVGGEVVDHQHADWGAYQIRRKGVCLSCEIYGYGNHFEWIWFQAGYDDGEDYFTGARYHNSVLMDAHGGDNTHGIDQAPPSSTAPALTKRSYADDTAGYMYMRGDESKQYDSDQLVTPAFPTNQAATFNRDFLYIKAADLIVFADRLTYTGAGTSQTAWIARFSGDPSMVGQRITSTYAGQSIVQNVIVPASAAFTEVNENVEIPEIQTYIVRPSWRIETRSGVSATTEWGLQGIQLGDSGFTPLTVTSLTTTNANVAQFGSTYVVGAMKDLTPTLSVTYVVSGTPRNLIMGLTPSTAYHVTRATNTITIAAATGSGDTTANAAGILDFTL